MKIIFLLCLCLAIPFSSFCSYKNDDIVHDFLREHVKMRVLIDELNQINDPMEIKFVKMLLKVEFLTTLAQIDRQIEFIDQQIDGLQESIEEDIKEGVPQDNINVSRKKLSNYKEIKENLLLLYPRVKYLMESTLNAKN